MTSNYLPSKPRYEILDGLGLLGDISYPLYIVQYAIVFGLQGTWATLHPDATPGQTIFINVSTFVLSLLVAWASLKLFDEPVRAWLKRTWLKR